MKKFGVNIQLFGEKAVTTDRIVGLREDLSPQLAYTNPNKAPLYMNLMALGNVETTTQTKISWVDYAAEGTQTSIKTRVASAGATTIEVEDATIFKDNSLIAIGSEVLLVSSIAGNTLTVERAQHGTTAGDAYEVGEEVFYINDNLEEGADLQGAKYKKGVNYSNNTQIIREEISMSGTALATNIPSSGGLDAYTLEQIRKMDLTLGKIEKAIVSGKKFEEGTKRGMDGVKSFLTKGQILDAGAEKISLEIIGAALEKIFNVGGDLAGGNYALYVPSRQKIKISKLLKDYITAPPQESTLGAVATHVATDFGTLPIIVSNNINSDEILILNHDDIKIRPLQGRELFHEYMGKKGDSIQGLILSELSLEVRNIHTMGIIKNLGK
ncbi:MAG: DUF5309 family protein [Fusobacterium gastrosuis]|uniref:SU10 major capsid protein n=1 Tax=Fusobacterium gastrosuis TaxID=1755100 RepID=UPI002A86A37E|nr:DUF5309 family protein [Fusobacterium gastrosuis]